MDISNHIAIMALIALYLLSKKRELIAVILFFYVAYMIAEFVSCFVYMTSTEWMIVNSIIDLIVITMCYHVIAYKNKSLWCALYLVYVICFHLTPNLIGANYSVESIEVVYRQIMNYAIPVDLAFAVLSSQNAMSRLIHGEFSN